MSGHPRIESADLASFCTSRTRNSELWFINNPELEQATLGYLAKFSKRYGVKLYAFSSEGSHHHTPSHFPKCNRADFMRDFNSCVAKAVKRLTPEYPGGKLFARPYSQEFLPAPEDIEEYFFYTVLQPVQDGLVPKISLYPGYNCFHDAIYGIEREYTVVDWARYNAAKRRNPRVRVQDFTEVVTLKYDRLPGYEHLSQEDYAEMMKERLEIHRQEVIKKREEEGKFDFLGPEKLLQMKRGTPAKKPKVSTRQSKRPRILCINPERWAYYMDWYFQIYWLYKAASKAFRSGDLTAEFPPGTYRPPLKAASPPPGAHLEGYN